MTWCASRPELAPHTSTVPYAVRFPSFTILAVFRAPTPQERGLHIRGHPLFLDAAQPFFRKSAARIIGIIA
jgi:hypothetical protein